PPRDVGIERQAREIVAGQEALGGEVAVAVEVGPAGRPALLQNRDLIPGIVVRTLDLLPFPRREAGDPRAAVGFLQLCPGRAIELAPAVEGPIEVLRRLGGDLLRSEEHTSELQSREN